MFEACIADRLVIGAKHWPRPRYNLLWAWTVQRLRLIYSEMKPDTMAFWEGLFSVRRNTNTRKILLIAIFRSNYWTEILDVQRPS